MPGAIAMVHGQDSVHLNKPKGSRIGVTCKVIKYVFYDQKQRKIVNQWECQKLDGDKTKLLEPPHHLWPLPQKRPATGTYTFGFYIYDIYL